MSSLGRFIMESQVLHIVCAVIAFIEFAGSILWSTLRGRRHARERARMQEAFAEKAGLRLHEDFSLEGTFEGIPVTLAPTRFEFFSRSTNHWTGRPTYRVQVPCGREECWIARHANVVHCREVVPETERSSSSGDAEFDGKFILAEGGSPSYLFWRDPQVRRSALELGLEMAYARDGVLVAHYYMDADNAASGHPWRVRRALYTTLAMLSQEQAGRWRTMLDLPLASRAPLGADVPATLISIISGVITALVLRHPHLWPGFVMGFAVTFPVALVLVLGIKALLRTLAPTPVRTRTAIPVTRTAAAGAAGAASSAEAGQRAEG